MSQEAIRKHNARKIQAIMQPFASDPHAFARAGKHLLSKAATQTLDRFAERADGGTIGLPASENETRAAVFGLFWWLLRRPHSMVTVVCLSDRHVACVEALVRYIVNATDPRIASHIVFLPQRHEQPMGFRVAGLSDWGMTIQSSPEIAPVPALHSAALELLVQQQSGELDLPNDAGVLRVSTWETATHGATS